MKVLLILFLLVVCYIVVFVVYKYLSHKREEAAVVMDCSHDVLSEIRTNNTYPLILDVFTSLNDQLSRCNEELHMDLRGYLDVEETK